MTVRNLDALFHPRNLWFLGAPGSGTLEELRARLIAGIGGPRLQTIDDGLAGIPPAEGPMLAVLGSREYADAATVTQLCERGCRALIWPFVEPPSAEVMAAARACTLRVLGPRTVGLARPASNLDVSLLAQSPQPGTLALIVQSQSIAAAAVDWATGRNIGFSWVAVTGGEADVDVADLLDYAALDPDTHAVAVEVGRIRGGRKFMSAARACARAKPTVILQTRTSEGDASGADPVRSAAFARAGLVEVPTLPALFDALAALQRLPRLESARVAIVANGSALCALSIDAALRQNLAVVELPDSRRDELLRHAPLARFLKGAVDLGDPSPAACSAALRVLLDADHADVVLFVRSPVAGHPHEPLARALVDANLGTRLLTVWLGLESAIPARQLSAESGLSTFTSPDAALRAVRYRYEHTRNRELLTQTPPHHALPRLQPERVAERLVVAHQRHGAVADAGICADLLRAYGLSSRAHAASDAIALALRLFRHPELGMQVAVRVHAPGLDTPTAYALPPLDPLVASRLLAQSGLRHVAAADIAAASQVLIRLGQIAMDQPRVALLEITATLRGGEAAIAEGGSLVLENAPGVERERLALAPYPAQREHRARMADGEDYDVRPVRPTDEPAVIALLQTLDPESIRLRFFAHIRYFSHAMAARMTQIDYDRELALVVVRATAPGVLVGIGTIISDPDDARAEFALLVHQSCAGIGLGRHLLEKLIEHARDRRIGVVFGEVLRENAPMLGLAQRLGFKRRSDPDDPACVRVELQMA